MPEFKVPFLALTTQHREMMPELLAAAERVLASGMFILGEEVERFEAEFAAYCGVEQSVALHSCTDALILALRAFHFGPEDEVITAPNSFLASASAISLAGARIRFADVGDDYNLDPADLERRITPRTRAIIVVHLTGRPARMKEILEIARRHDLRVIEDCAQAVGATYGGQAVGTLGDVGCFSLHPLKNLNACGDGGVIIAKDRTLTEWFVKARNHGLRDRDTCDFWSYNVRLDALQAALIRAKLPKLEEWTEARRRNAARYRRGLAGVKDVKLPPEEVDLKAVYHLFVIQHERRDALQKHLTQAGIDTKIHYPIPIHLQPAARAEGFKEGDLPECERQARRILSLPVHQYLTDDQIDYVIESIRAFGR